MAKRVLAQCANSTKKPVLQLLRGPMLAGQCQQGTTPRRPWTQQNKLSVEHLTHPGAHFWPVWLPWLACSHGRSFTTPGPAPACVSGTGWLSRLEGSPMKLENGTQVPANTAQERCQLWRKDLSVIRTPVIMPEGILASAPMWREDI